LEERIALALISAIFSGGGVYVTMKVELAILKARLMQLVGVEIAVAVLKEKVDYQAGQIREMIGRFPQ